MRGLGKGSLIEVTASRDPKLYPSEIKHYKGPATLLIFCQPPFTIHTVWYGKKVVTVHTTICDVLGWSKCGNDGKGFEALRSSFSNVFQPENSSVQRAQL